MTFSIEKFPHGNSEIPVNKMVNVVVSEFGTLESGRIAVTCKLASAKEVDDAINSLIKELEQIRKQAKKALL